MRNYQPMVLKADENQQGFSTELSKSQSNSTYCSKEGNVHFLPVKNPVPNKGGTAESIQLENADEYLNDIQTMTATQLGKKYKLTYDTWKNMKQRCKKLGYILDIKFNKFADFLKHMGPRTNKNFTLDRIDSGNPNYSPENCRWADKHTQNRNKSNNVLLTMNGETHPVSVWASKTQQKADTLYKRIAKDWTDEEVITGVKHESPSTAGNSRINIVSLNTEKLYELLPEALKAVHSIQQQMLHYYELDAETPPPLDVVARYEKAQMYYRKLFSAMQKRVPGFDMHSHFPMLFSGCD